MLILFYLVFGLIFEVFRVLNPIEWNLAEMSSSNFFIVDKAREHILIVVLMHKWIYFMELLGMDFAVMFCVRKGKEKHLIMCSFISFSKYTFL